MCAWIVRGPEQGIYAKLDSCSTVVAALNTRLGGPAFSCYNGVRVRIPASNPTPSTHLPGVAHVFHSSHTQLPLISLAPNLAPSTRPLSGSGPRPGNVAGQSTVTTINNMVVLPVSPLPPRPRPTPAPPTLCPPSPILRARPIFPDVFPRIPRHACPPPPATPTTICPRTRLQSASAHPAAHNHVSNPSMVLPAVHPNPHPPCPPDLDVSFFLLLRRAHPRSS